MARSKKALNWINVDKKTKHITQQGATGDQTRPKQKHIYDQNPINVKKNLLTFFTGSECSVNQGKPKAYLKLSLQQYGL